MESQIAMLLRTKNPVVETILTVAIIVLFIGKLTTFFWPEIGPWWQNARTRNWPKVPATIDNATVVAKTEESDYDANAWGYLVTVTYSYRYPDMHIKGCSRMFEYEEVANTWVKSRKGKIIYVRVNPRDPSQSEICEEDF